MAVGDRQAPNARRAETAHEPRQAAHAYDGSDALDILDAGKVNTWEGGASFTLANRAYRAAWSVVWLIFASWTPAPMHRWRRLLLLAFGAKIARTAGVYPSARIWSPANLEMGDYAFIGPRVIVYSMAKITFAPYSLASQGAHLCAGAHDVEDVNFQLQAKPIRIGYRAWIAAEAFVGPGVVVGDGAVLGARGCAFRDLDPWRIYVGNPARPTRARKVRFPSPEAL